MHRKHFSTGNTSSANNSHQRKHASDANTGVVGPAGDPGDSNSMAVSVTRHAPPPQVAEYTHLLSGIDSLDLGLYVVWGSDWKRRLSLLDKLKQQARHKNGLVIPLPTGRSCIFKPGGKGDSYRFHLQFAEYNIFLAKSAHPTNDTPNVYLSINSQTLWNHGVAAAVAWATDDLKAIANGTVHAAKPSRVDLAADFHIPGGLDHDFLLDLKVTRNETEKFYRGANKLETFYLGNAKSPIQLRIYNKGLEVQKGGTKLWFLDHWQRDTPDDVWRVEFQIRRAALKEFGIDSLHDLSERAAGLWQYLTTSWFSLRIPDNDKAERRTVHPLWATVQHAASGFGSIMEIERTTAPSTAADPSWHISHIDGCLSSYAALMGITSRDEAIASLLSHLNHHKAASDFKESCIKKAIQFGTLAGGGN